MAVIGPYWLEITQDKVALHAHCRPRRQDGIRKRLETACRRHPGAYSRDIEAGGGIQLLRLGSQVCRGGVTVRSWSTRSLSARGVSTAGSEAFPSASRPS